MVNTVSRPAGLLFLHFMPRCLLTLFFALVFVGASQSALARVNTQKWGIVLTQADSAQIRITGMPVTDSLLKLDTFHKSAAIYSINHDRHFRNLTPDFYLLCVLCLMLGAIRYFDPRYFALLVGAFRTPGTGRQWKDMLSGAALPNLGMNIFFAAVVGAYIYYLSGGSNNKLLGFRAPLVLPILIFGMLAIYAGKYAVVRFSGWAFGVESLADQYLFNVFLVNKITAIVLLPFVIIIAFAGQEWLKPLGILSSVIALAILSTRYLRSWSAFITFFKGSRFHFFTYLCASEILPMAVLVKWLLHLLR
jgi:hypothetical protein